MQSITLSAPWRKLLTAHVAATVSVLCQMTSSGKG
jgi:hypothetical protein